jgi:hypothetical protein
MLFQATYCLHAITSLLPLGPLKIASNHKLKMSHASLMKNKSQSNNEIKTTITLSWKIHLIQSDANSLDEILRQKQDTKMKRGRIARNKHKVAKLCTWKAAADVNPNSEQERQNLHHSSSVDETYGCHNTVYSMIKKWLCSNHSGVISCRVILLKQIGCLFYL